MTIRIESSMTTRNGNVFASLNREATNAKSQGDWVAAVALLRHAKAHVGDLYQETRLAKLLEQTGQLEDALQEIQWLLDKSHAWAQAMFSHQPASVLLRQRTLWRAQIYADAALICKRSKRPDLQAEFEREHDACRALVEKIDPVADADKAARSQEWQEARRGGHSAMQSLIQTRAVATERNRSKQ